MKLTMINNIGHGGFGIVDKVTNEAGKIFARKTFSVNQGPLFPKHLIENVKKRFIREAIIQSEIKHKNIVPVLEKFLVADPPYFLMPLALSSLEDDHKIDSTLDGKYMNAIMDIIAGLEELHSVRIYHRDLKPANVLRFAGVNGEKRDFYAIGDFGLMSMTQTNISTLTQTGMKMGSDYYTAPEIVKDLRDASCQSDIYSLGCILHDFVGSEDRIPCNEIREKGDFAGILLNCTRKDPDRRFKSVIALRDALLSLGDVHVKAKTVKGAAIFDVLTNIEADIPEEDWKSIIDFVEDEYDNPDAIAVLRKLSIQHIDNLILKYSRLSSKLGMLYARWIRENSFNFEECDGLSIRLQKFIDGCDIDVQCEALMAMLHMGTGHNRYYVEKKFVQNVGKSLDENLARRLAIEIRVDENESCKAIKHLQHSINYNVSNLHPILFNIFNEVCK